MFLIFLYLTLTSILEDILSSNVIPIESPYLYSELIIPTTSYSLLFLYSKLIVPSSL